MSCRRRMPGPDPVRAGHKPTEAHRSRRYGMTSRGMALATMPETGTQLSVGVLTADLTRLGAEMEVIRGRAHWAHVDVMDGSFCPQLTVGPSFIKAVGSTGVPVDAHLMIEDPLGMLPDVVHAGAGIVTVHAESG